MKGKLNYFPMDINKGFVGFLYRKFKGFLKRIPFKVFHGKV